MSWDRGKLWLGRDVSCCVLVFLANLPLLLSVAQEPHEDLLGTCSDCSTAGSAELALC